MQLRPINLDPRTIRDAVFYAAVLLLPGGSLIALAVWLFGRLTHRAPVVTPVAIRPAAQPGMTPETVLAYAAGVAVAGGVDLGAPLSTRSARAVETV